MLDPTRAVSFVNNNLGGHAYRARLNARGWTNEEIKERHLEMIEAREPVIRFMGGEEVYESLPGEWREPMLALSALRLLCEEA